MGWVVRERPDGRRAGADAGMSQDARARWRDRAAKVGERMAEEFLLLRGFEILGRNVRAGHGEIDLIARDADAIVFVEVKLRSSGDPAGPVAAVNWKKREDVERAATRWLQSRGFTNRTIRFDVVGITWEADGSHLRVEHIRNAFPGGGRHFY